MSIKVFHVYQLEVEEESRVRHPVLGIYADERQIPQFLVPPIVQIAYAEREQYDI